MPDDVNPYASGCEGCSDLNFMYPGPGLEIELSSMRSASRLGCKSCILITSALEPFGLPDTDIVYLAREGEGTLTLRIFRDLSAVESIGLDFFVPIGSSYIIPVNSMLSTYPARDFLPMACNKVNDTQFWGF
jgi:hypothetical protein